MGKVPNMNVDVSEKTLSALSVLKKFLPSFKKQTDRRVIQQENDERKE